MAWIINLIILIATGSSRGLIRSLEHDVAQAAVLGLKIVIKEPASPAGFFIYCDLLSRYFRSNN